MGEKLSGQWIHAGVPKRETSEQVELPQQPGPGMFTVRRPPPTVHPTRERDHGVRTVYLWIPVEVRAYSSQRPRRPAPSTHGSTPRGRWRPLDVAGNPPSAWPLPGSARAVGWKQATFLVPIRLGPHTPDTPSTQHNTTHTTPSDAPVQTTCRPHTQQAHANLTCLAGLPMHLSRLSCFVPVLSPACFFHSLRLLSRLDCLPSQSSLGTPLEVVFAFFVCIFFICFSRGGSALPSLRLPFPFTPFRQ